MSSSNPISPVSGAQSFIADNMHKPEVLPGLYIVATPIGNLRDITLRALDVLAAADIILAEDTRHTQKLLSAYNIQARLRSYYDHNAARRIPQVLKALADGQIVAQVSDAGTPLVSDPGYRLVRAALDAGHSIVPVPGASAVLTALMGAGLPTDIFTFAGFLPAKSAARRKQLQALKSAPGTLIFFESGHRISDMLSDLLAVTGERKAVIARELTKTYEEFRRGTLKDLMESVREEPPKGEIVVLVEPGETEVWDETRIDAELGAKVPELGVKRASAEIAKLSGWAKRDVYQRALDKS